MSWWPGGLKTNLPSMSVWFRFQVGQAFINLTFLSFYVLPKYILNDND